MTPYDPDPLHVIEWHRGAQDRRRSLREQGWAYLAALSKRSPGPRPEFPDDLDELVESPDPAIWAGLPASRWPRRSRLPQLLAATALALFLVGLFLGHVTARASRATVIPASSFHDVQSTWTPRHDSASRVTDTSPARYGPTSGASLILDPAPSRTPVPRASVEQPAPELVTVTEKPVVVNPPSSGARGPASWYDDPRKAGLYAAAGPALRVGDWRGRTVTVCASSCFAVVLSDWCGCPGGRVIDLSSTAFARLAPLSQGVVSVVVTW